ncbi:MAG: tryptophan--tRNA ligase [Candidatus Lloydbacteria bacterium RIFCSPHIGHO2_01_FULL_41_20]|uniref:Tryptophan--tRNA ligase n=1 Tax=Candidatus Lloydbacteria bacterium RIFCSPHIGHO2_01_FULL_41_20 TaxID=1798657 RepID=A0A1G2CQX8_9BACT|nr:MAG: tryptophan--tRNA ligase [Candidatus Lloydbacteria bacterium RIFCSPHIGHO2_01_FULL_41_20]
MKKILVSGIKPSGNLHIGNYFGAIKQLVELQEKYDSFVFVANYHALTTPQERTELERNTLELAASYIASGIDPEKTALFLQSDVSEVAELAWIFNTITTMPYLMRAHAFKDAEAKNKETNVGLFGYPLLMAADILIQDANVVPVGADQKQHVEIARDTAEKFNRLFGDTFVLPEPLILDEVKTIIGTDGQKMSKSYNNIIGLFDEHGEIKKAVMSIPTDSKGVDEPKDPEICNVFALHKLFSNKAELSVLARRYRDGGLGYKESKDLLVEKMEKFIKPLREKRKEILSNPEELKIILKNGGERARERAMQKMKEVRDRVGLNI